MDWTPGGSNSDIEDRRGESGGGGGFGFGGGGFGGIHLGIGGMIVVGILSLVFHQNLFYMFSGVGPAPSPVARTQPVRSGADPEKREVDFMSFVLGDVQSTWEKILPQQEQRPYRHAKLVLFSNSTESACGTAQTAIGPFYCPEDEKVYLDLGFFEELRDRFGAKGEFAQAYVVAHEIGHHVQKLLGIEPRVRRLQQRDPSEANPLSVKLELQADCFAGVWANSTEQRGIVHEDDVESALSAAAAVGDDRLQRAARGYVSPESFTHGTSAQRTQWFRRGLDSGRVASCSTFQSQSQ
jgi:predicted metalloprotease